MGTTLVIAIVVLALSLIGGYAPLLLKGRLSNQALEDLTGIASGLLLTSGAAARRARRVPRAAELAHDSGSDEAFAYEPVVLGFTILLGFVVMLLLEGFGIGPRGARRAP